MEPFDVSSKPDHCTAGEMKLSLFEIKYDNPQGRFLAGSSISGVLHIGLSKPMKMKAIHLYFVGNGKTHYRPPESYLRYCLTLFKSETGDTSLHAAGQHTYPFSLKLWERNPSSFESKNGYIRYFCKATIERPWKYNLCLKQMFTVVHNLDLNLVPSSLIPIDVQTRKEIKSLFNTVGYVDVTMSLNKSGYVPGEPIAYDILVNNQSDFNITKVDLKLIQVTTYTGYNGSFTKVIKLFTQEVVIGKHSNSQIKQAAILPNLPASKLEGCSIMNVKYIVALKIVCNGNKLKIARGVTVGTIPTREATVLQEVPTQSFSYASSMSSIQSTSTLLSNSLSNIDFQVSLDNISELDSHIIHASLPTYEEAIAPPPSYLAPVFVCLSRQDENVSVPIGDGENLVPAYSENTNNDVNLPPAYSE